MKTIMIKHIKVNARARNVVLKHKQVRAGPQDSVFKQLLDPRPERNLCEMFFSVFHPHGVREYVSATFACMNK